MHESTTTELQAAYEWAKSIVESCSNSFHLECARKIIELFEARYGQVEEYFGLLEAMVAKEPMLMVG